MKSILLIIFGLVTFGTWGQTVRLKTSNPAPRVGEPISISFDLEKNDLDSLEISNDPLDKLLIQSMNQVGDGQIEISEWFLTDTGLLKIGPLRIPINGKVYETTALTMTVSPTLPENIDNGIWIRQLEFDGEEYVILEQRQPGRMKPKTDSHNRTTYAISTADVTWAELNIDKVERKGIEIEETGSRSSIQIIDVGSALYMVTVYKYKPLESFKGQLTIDRDLLFDIPKEGHFEVIRVKN